MKRVIKYIVTLTIFIVSTSCDQSINNNRVCNLKTTFIDSTDIIPFSDKLLLEFAQHGSKYPSGFYTENLSNSSLYYVNTVSTGVNNNKWIYLCTDESSQAFNWIDSSTYRTLIDLTQTDKYFQAVGIDSSNLRHHILFRVHKCSYIDRSIYDGLNRSDSIGILNQRPINETNVKEVIEYLWFTNNYNIGNPKILFTEYKETQNECIYILYVTNYYVGDWGMCPGLNVEKQTYAINKNNGLILYNPKIIRVISDP
jgi:hypothetical protein